MNEQEQHENIILSAELSALMENDTRRARVTRKWERHKLLKKIRMNPAHFFTLEGFGEDEINTTRTCLAGRDWLDCVRMSFEGERQVLLKKYQPEIVDALIEFGWVWRHEKTCLFVRDKAIVSGFKPEDSLRMIFVLKGQAWEPSYRLLSLAKAWLKVPCPTSIGNVSGSHLEGKMAGVRALRSYADFLVQHGTDKFRDEAAAQRDHCDRLLRMLTPQSDTLLVEAAMNVVRCDSVLRELVESELIEEIIHRHGMSRSKKGASTGIRMLVVEAYLKASRLKQSRATKDDVIAELKKSKVVEQNKKGHLLSIDGKSVSDATLNEWLEDIRPQFSELYPAPIKRGRPRKE